MEHYGGAFPIWLSPEQAVVIPVAQAFHEYAHEVANRLAAKGVLVRCDDSDQRMNAKIRNAQNLKIPYMLIVGEKEQTDRSVSVRNRRGEQTNGVPIEDFLALVLKNIEQRENI